MLRGKTGLKIKLWLKCFSFLILFPLLKLDFAKSEEILQEEVEYIDGEGFYEHLFNTDNLSYLSEGIPCTLHLEQKKGKIVNF